MYCRNCGNPMEAVRSECSRCGSPKGMGGSFCPACGQRQEPGAENCPVCGCGLNLLPAPKGKSRLAAGLLGIFLGFLGIHNFYLGYRGKAWGQLLITVLSLGTLSFLSGLWGLVEGIFYLTGRYTSDGNDNPLEG